MRRALIALYPEAWRRRYAEEMDALLEEQPPRPRAVFDLLRGALLAHLREAPGLGRLECARNSVSGVLGSFLCFVFSAAAFSQSTEDPPFRAAGRGHTLMSVTRGAFLAAAIASVVALLVAAAPLAIRVLTEAHRTRRRDLLRLIAAPPVAIGALALGLGLVALWQSSHHGPERPIGVILLILVGVAAVSAAIVCWAAPRAIMRGFDVGRPALSLAVPAVGAVAALMWIATLSIAVYLVVILADAPGLAASPDGPGGIGVTDVDIAVQLVAMAAFSMTAALSARRGLRALHAE
jgi:hypothetical protein